MKSQMSSFDIAAVVREMQSCIGLKAEKFFLLEHKSFFFRLASGPEKRTITINLGQGIWLEDGFRTTTDSEPANFAMMLRKYLSGKAIKSIRQQGFDRIVLIEFDTEPTMTLIAELFGSGNLLLLENNKIFQPLTSKSWRAREVKAGHEYVFPPESRDPFSMDRAKLAELLAKSEKDLVRCLATEINLSGVYSEEVCHILGRSKSDKASELTGEEIDEIMDIIGSFREGLLSPEPYILLGEGGVPVDVLPFGLTMHEELEKQQFPGFSVAAREYFQNLPDKAQMPMKSDREAQLDRQLESQEAALKELDIQDSEFQIMGDLVYANYSKLDNALKYVNGMLSGGNWQALRRDIEAIPGVTKFEPAEGALSVTLPDGLSVTLDVRLNVNENAAALYDRSKKARQKAIGAREAILHTRALLKDLQEAGEIARQPKDRKPTKQFWFDRFRWFISSEGFMVVGGRDTRSNDLVVKKHLKDEDLYAHADANGAPSVVIKDGQNATEATLEEACAFAVCFSRVWKGKLASGSAYWVKPDQVSKTPQPGEFVPKGAFIIRGTRNYSRKVEVRLAVGMVKVQGADKLMCGPVSALKVHASEYMVFEPGDEKRSDLAKKLSDKHRIPIEEADRVLPAGDVRLISQQ